MNDIDTSSKEIERAKTIEHARSSFEKLSHAMINIAKYFGSSGSQPILLYHCPMAFDFKGADWLQNKEGTENPYFGSEMFRCGSQLAILTNGDKQSSGESSHE